MAGRDPAGRLNGLAIETRHDVPLSYKHRSVDVSHLFVAPVTQQVSPGPYGLEGIRVSFSEELPAYVDRLVQKLLRIRSGSLPPHRFGQAVQRLGDERILAPEDA